MTKGCLKHCKRRIVAGLLVIIMLCGIAYNSPILLSALAANSNTSVAATVTLKDFPEYNANGYSVSAGGFYFEVNEADPLAADPIGWTTRYLATEGGVYVNGQAKSNVQLIKTADKRYYANLSEAGITINVGDVVTIDGIFGAGTTYVKFKPASFTYYETNKWKITDLNVSVSTTVTILDHAYNANGVSATAGGFHFEVTPQDTLAYDSVGWTTRYLAVKGGVYANEVLKENVQLIKTAANRYYVNLSEAGVGINTGDKVTIDGIFGDGTTYVKYQSATFEYLGSNKWQLMGEDETITTTVTIEDYPTYNADGVNTSAGGFYFETTPSDTLAHDSAGWTTRYLATEGGVSVNGVLKEGVQLIKTTQNRYYVNLSEAGVLIQDGDEVTIEGIFGADKNFVDFTSATFKYLGSNKWQIKNAIQEEPLSEAVKTIYDLFDLVGVSTVTVTNDSGFNLTNLKQKTNVGLKATVQSEFLDSNQCYTIGVSKKVANFLYDESGYQIKIFPLLGRIDLLVGVETVVATVNSIEAIKSDYELEYGLVDMYDNSSALVGRKLYVKVNDVDVISYLDSDLTRELGTYAPVYAFSYNQDFKVAFGSLKEKDYRIVGATPIVKDISELIDGLSSIEANPAGNTPIGDMKASENVALRTKVTFNTKFDTYADPIYNELFIGISQKQSDTMWDEDKSGYEVWFHPGYVFVGSEGKSFAEVAYDIPQEFVLEFGTYNLDIYKNGEKIGLYGRQIYVKIDGVEVISVTEQDLNRTFGSYAVVNTSASTDVTLSSLTSTKYLIRKSNTVADIYDATGLSEVTLIRDGQTKLGTLPNSSSIALRTKVKLESTDLLEFKIAISKKDQWFWDLEGEGTGWQFWFRPQLGQVFIGYGISEQAAVCLYEFKEEFLLEIGERDVVTNSGEYYGREIYIIIDGEEVLTWIDKYNERPLGKYMMAYATNEASVKLTSLTTTGYIPVDSVYIPKDLHDVSQFCEMELAKDECMTIGSLEDFKNRSIKMNVKLNAAEGDYPEFKIATAKSESTTMWDIGGSGYQFWFRPAFNTISIGYGISECAETRTYEYKDEFELELGARTVTYKNGKKLGTRVFINIDGEEVLSWIDTNENRIMGNYIVSYASAGMDVTISTLYDTITLPVTYVVNGEQVDNYHLVKVYSKVVKGKDTLSKVQVHSNQKIYVDYEKFSFNEENLMPERAYTDDATGRYVYLLEEPKATDKITVELSTKELTVDEARIFDLYDVSGATEIQVDAFEDQGIGNFISDGEACGVNSAIRFIVDLPKSYNSVRVTLLGDTQSVWSRRGSMLNIKNGRVSLSYPGTQRVLSEVLNPLFAGGNSVAIEWGIVKCYADGLYKYDRHYIKAGKSIDDMELIAWYDNTQRGGYGTGVVARGTDYAGSDFTLRTTKNIHTITDISSDEQKGRLDSRDAIGEVRYSVFYPETVVHGASATIKLYTKEGMKLEALYVAGKKVDVVESEDGACIYEIPKVSGNVRFSYSITEDAGQLIAQEGGKGN